MKGKWNLSLLPWLVCICGGVGAALWTLMQRLCRDERGLLISGNLPGILLALLSVGICAAIVWLVRPLAGSNRYPDNFAASGFGALSHFALAAGLLWMLLANSPQDVLATIHWVLGLLSLPCVVLAGVARWKGKRPNFLFYGCLCIFFGIHMVQQYRLWSGRPQMADYLCQLLACATLTLAAYHQAAFAVGMGNRVRQLATGLMAAYFCIASCTGENVGIFYLTCGLWSLTNLCDPIPKPLHGKSQQAGDVS